MSRPSLLARVLIPAAIWLSLPALATAQTASPPAAAPTTSPAATQAPADSTATPAPSATTPAPSTAAPAPATPAPTASDSATPATPPATTTPPAAAQAPATPPADQKGQAAEPFGEEVTLTAKKVLSLRGTSNWESAFDNIVESIKTLTTFLKKQNVTPAGPALIVYTSTDDAGFSFLAEIPVDKDIKDVGKDMSMSQSPDGKALKFVHHGSYDNMDNTYEAITNHLDDKKLEAKDTFIEEYVTDPLTTTEDKLVINVFVPLK
jgi:effector-binding domain-containing protein